MTGLFSLNYVLILEYSLFIQSPLYSDNAIYPNVGGVLDRSLGTKKALFRRDWKSKAKYMFKG